MENNNKAYTPQPADCSGIVLSEDILALAEQLARNTHEVWAKGRVEQGWIYGAERNDARRETPCLLPYEQLPESEKDYDRRTALETLRLIQKLGYQLVRTAE